MCTVLAATSILEILQEGMKNGEVFTSFDITVGARAVVSDKVFHSDVRRIVNGEFDNGEMASYNRELCSLNIPSSPQAFVFFPDGKLATDHPLVSDSTDPNDGTDDGTDGTVSVVLDDDEYKLTKDGRVNIPKKLFSQIVPSAGSYDVLVNGSLKSVAPNKDGRVRLCLIRIGINDSKVKLSVDTTNNTINLETI